MLCLQSRSASKKINKAARETNDSALLPRHTEKDSASARKNQNMLLSYTSLVPFNQLANPLSQCFNLVWGSFKQQQFLFHKSQVLFIIFTEKQRENKMAAREDVRKTAYLDTNPLFRRNFLGFLLPSSLISQPPSPVLLLLFFHKIIATSSIFHKIYPEKCHVMSCPLLLFSVRLGCVVLVCAIPLLSTRRSKFDYAYFSINYQCLYKVAS